MAPKQKSAPDVTIGLEATAATKALEPAIKRLAKNLKNLDPTKLPLGAAADLLYDLRQISKQLSTVTAAMMEDIVTPTIKLLEEHFVQTLAVGESSGVQGLHSRVQITESVVPVVEDWAAFYTYIGKTKSFELLNKAVNTASVRERWDAKKQVPGVGKFTAKKVSATKLGGKK